MYSIGYVPTLLNIVSQSSVLYEYLTGTNFNCFVSLFALRNSSEFRELPSPFTLKSEFKISRQVSFSSYKAKLSIFAMTLSGSPVDGVEITS